MRVHTHQLTDAQVALVIDRLAAGVRQCDIAREFGVSRTLIYGIKVGRTWKHIPRGASNVSAG
jgi:transposase-like protein